MLGKAWDRMVPGLPLYNASKPSMDEALYGSLPFEWAQGLSEFLK